MCLLFTHQFFLLFPFLLCYFFVTSVTLISFILSCVLYVRIHQICCAMPICYWYDTVVMQNVVMGNITLVTYSKIQTILSQILNKSLLHVKVSAKIPSTTGKPSALIFLLILKVVLFLCGFIRNEYFLTSCLPK